MHAAGTWRQYAGVSGTVSLTPGAVLAQLTAHATSGPASVSIFGGPAIHILAGDRIRLEFEHDLAQAQNDAASTGSADIVFTGTDSYWFEAIGPGNT